MLARLPLQSHIGKRPPSALPVDAPPQHEDRAWHVCFSPRDPDLLLSCGADRQVAQWRRGESGWVRQLTFEDVHSRTIRAVEFSPDGKRVAACSFDGTVTIWKRKSREEDVEEMEADGTGNAEWETVATLEGHENEVKSVSWSHDGRYLATCGRDKTVWIWESPTSECGEHASKADGEEDDEDEEGMEIFDPDKRLTTYALEGDRRAPRQEDYECASVLTGHEGDVKFVKFHPSEYLLVSTSYDDTVKLWISPDYYIRKGVAEASAADDWCLLVSLNGHTNTVWGATFVDASTLVTCSQDLTVKIWKRSESGGWSLHTDVPTSHTRTIFSIDFHRGYLVTSGGDDAVVVYRVVKDEGEGGEFGRVFARECARFRDTSLYHTMDVNCVRWNRAAPEGVMELGTACDDGRVAVFRFQPPA